jgi:DNA-binding transcriptional LysR family regulator
VVGSLLEKTDLIAVLPARLIGVMPYALETFETPVPVKGFRLDAVWPTRLHASPLHQWLRGEIARAAEGCAQR